MLPENRFSWSLQHASFRLLHFLYQNSLSLSCRSFSLCYVCVRSDSEALQFAIATLQAFASLRSCCCMRVDFRNAHASCPSKACCQIFPTRSREYPITMAVSGSHTDKAPPVAAAIDDFEAVDIEIKDLGYARHPIQTSRFPSSCPGVSRP